MSDPPKSQTFRVLMRSSAAVELEGLADSLRVSWTLCTLRVLLEGQPKLPMGSSWAIEFLDEEGPSLVDLEGKVILLRSLGTGLEVHFELDARVLEGLIRADERRKSFRVQPLPGEPIAATLRPLGSAALARGQVFDLSADGAGVLVPEIAEGKLTNVWDADVALALPGQERELQVRARIQQRRLHPAGLLYGLAFDWEACEDRQARELVRAYVMRRQVQIIRERRDRALLREG